MPNIRILPAAKCGRFSIRCSRGRSGRYESMRKTIYSLLTIISLCALIIFSIALFEHASGNLQYAPENTKSNNYPAFSIVKHLPFINYGDMNTRNILIAVVQFSLLGSVIGIALFIKSTHWNSRKTQNNQTIKTQINS